MSKHTGRARRVAILLLLLLGSGIHFLLGNTAIRAQSPTFDEGIHITAGYAYLTTKDYRLNGLFHPPLSFMTASVPLLKEKVNFPFDKPAWINGNWTKGNQYAFSHEFLYKRNNIADHWINTGRYTLLLISLCLLISVFAAQKTLSSIRAAFITFFISIFSPSFLAHDNLVTNDFMFSIFFLLFFISFGIWERVAFLRQSGSLNERGKPACRVYSTESVPEAALWKWPILSGILLGAAFCSKFSAILILPILGARLLYRRFRLYFTFQEWILGWFAFFITLVLVYQISELPVFFKGLYNIFFRLGEGLHTFLMGKHSTTGWWYFFPAVFLLKTPFPVLIGLSISVFYYLKKKISLPWFLTFPPLFYFLVACSSPVQIGHRHLLPIYPFIFVIAGIGLSRFLTRKRGALILMILGAWLVSGTFFARPFFISYFNEITNLTQKKGFEYLSDSNIDWGQGLRSLKQYLKQEKIDQIYFSYFGSADPAHYGIKYSSVVPYTIPLFRDFNVDLRKEKRALFVISATNYQGTYFIKKDLFGWLKSKTPEKILGGGLLIFDITNDNESHRQLASLFWQMGNTRLAKIEDKWAKLE